MYVLPVSYHVYDVPYSVFFFFARSIFCGIKISCVTENFRGLNFQAKQVVQSGYTCWQHGQRKRVGPPDLSVLVE